MSLKSFVLSVQFAKDLFISEEWSIADEGIQINRHIRILIRAIAGPHTDTNAKNPKGLPLQVYLESCGVLGVVESHAANFQFGQQITKQPCHVSKHAKIKHTQDI